MKRKEQTKTKKYATGRTKEQRWKGNITSAHLDKILKNIPTNLRKEPAN